MAHSNLQSDFRDQNPDVTGLVFGKFSPFHKGHEMLIRESLKQCDQLYVLAYDHPELNSIPTPEMVNLMRIIINDDRVKIIECYGSPPPGTTLADQQAHNEYARKQLPDGLAIDKVFNNEWYGRHIAEYFKAQHILIDPNRHQYPISATKIRANPQQHLDHLHALVAHCFMRHQNVLNNNVEIAFTEVLDPSFVTHTLSAEDQKRIKDTALLANPNYDDAKLNGMLSWDVGQFTKPHLPAVIGELKDKEGFSAQRGLRVLDMALRMPDQGWKIPIEFAQFSEALRMATEHERSINPEFDDQYYVYITIDQKLVLPNKSQRRHGYHSDAFVTGETNDIENDDIVLADNTYVMADKIPTEFQPGPFPFQEAGIDPEDCAAVLKFFDDQSKGKQPITFPPHALLRMTPYDIHTPGFNDTDEAIKRTFIKIQFSKQRYNLVGNTINPNFNYEGWTWVPRDPNVRNHRNSIIDWSRPDKDLFTTIAADDVDFTHDTPPQLSWAKAQFIWAAKTEAVKAEPARAGDMLYTMHGNNVMTVNIAQAGDLKITTSQDDQYFLSKDTFAKRYHTDMDEDGYYRPIGELQKMLEVTKPVKLKALWGAWQYAPVGSMLTSLGSDDTWLIHKKNYDASYEKQDPIKIEQSPEYL